MLKELVPVAAMLSLMFSCASGRAEEIPVKVDLVQDLNWKNHHFVMTNWFYNYKWDEPAAQIAILTERGYDSVMLSLKDDPQRC